MVSGVINFNCSLECLKDLQVFMAFTITRTCTHSCVIICLLIHAGLLVHARDLVTLENLEARQKVSSRASQSSI